MAVTLPVNLTTDTDRYRHLYAAMEALRLKHNTRQGDTSASAHAFRLECYKLQSRIVGEILKLRPKIADKGYVPAVATVEPNHAKLKGEGKLDHEAADLKAITGVDLDAFTGAKEPPPDPLENFTGYTEQDSGSDVTVAASSLTVATMAPSADAYVYDDKGASHFETGLEHYFQLNASAAANGSYGGAWAITNTAGSYADMSGNEAVGVYVHGTFTTKPLYLINFEDSSNDSYSSFSLSTDYYCTVDWSGATTIELKIYSNSLRTVLVDTLSISVTSGRKYRYVEGMFSYDQAGSGDISYVVSNLDLNDVSNTTLVVSDVDIATSIDTFALTQAHTLAVGALDIATSIETAAVCPVLIVDGLDITTSLDTFALTQAHTLVVDALDIATSIDTVAPGVALIVDGLDIATSIDTAAPVGVALIVDALDIGTSIDTINPGVALTVDGLDIATSLDTFPLTQAHILAMQDIGIATCARRPLTVSDMAIGVGIDTVALDVALTVSALAVATSIETVGSGIILNISDIAVAIGIDTVGLVSDTPLTVSDLAIATSIDSTAPSTVTGAVVVTFTGTRPEVAHVAV